MPVASCGRRLVDSCNAASVPALSHSNNSKLRSFPGRGTGELVMRSFLSHAWRVRSIAVLAVISLSSAAPTYSAERLPKAGAESAEVPHFPSIGEGGVLHAFLWSMISPCSCKQQTLFFANGDQFAQSPVLAIKWSCPKLEDVQGVLRLGVSPTTAARARSRRDGPAGRAPAKRRRGLPARKTARKPAPTPNHLTLRGEWA